MKFLIDFALYFLPFLILIIAIKLDKKRIERLERIHLKMTRMLDKLEKHVCSNDAIVYKIYALDNEFNKLYARCDSIHNRVSKLEINEIDKHE